MAVVFSLPGLTVDIISMSGYIIFSDFTALQQKTSRWIMNREIISIFSIDIVVVEIAVQRVRVIQSMETDAWTCVPN